jgi:hypothetical protein
LRKALKIKTFTVLLAWLVIFAHSIIPHNHLQEHYDELRSLIHYTEHVQECPQIKDIISTNQPDNEKVCHFGENLFHQLNCDELFDTSIKIISLHTPDEENLLVFNEKDQVIPDFILYPNSLRAPPIPG